MSGEEGDNEFRVLVGMERFFSDERARVYMSCRRSRPVRSLVRRLRRTFALPRRIALLSRGHLLPPDEPLALLQPDDPVEVIPSSTYISCKPIEYNPEGVSSAGAVLLTSDEVDAANDGDASLSTAPVDDIHHTPACSPCHRTTDEAIALDDLKRQALSILESYEAPPPPRRTRRRRVRRRPRAPGLSTVPELQSASPVRETSDVVVPAEPEEPRVDDVTSPDRAPPPPPPAVLRLDPPVRVARLVRDQNAETRDLSASECAQPLTCVR